MRALAIALAVTVGLVACGDGGDDNSSISSTPNNASANGSPSGSCFHNCVTDGPLGQLESFGCLSGSSEATCASDAQAHCDGLGWGTSAASEFITECAACGEACAPSFYDCSNASCSTSSL